MASETVPHSVTYPMSVDTRKRQNQHQNHDKMIVGCCTPSYIDIYECVDESLFVDSVYGGCCVPEFAPSYKKSSNAINRDSGFFEVDVDDDGIAEELADRFEILSTENDDPKVHVLTPSLMQLLQRHIPISKQGESFWLKYSLVRDGASISTLLDKIANTENVIMAVETVDGDVFGAYTSQAWRISPDFYGSGESFLWRSRFPRSSSFTSLLEKRGEKHGSEIEVFKFAFRNRNIQLCHHDRIAIGGGDLSDDYNKWGFGLVFEKDLLRGTSSPCVTFMSPSLSSRHPDGEVFEVRNLEVWTLTPCVTMDEAEKLTRNIPFRYSHIFPS